VADVRQFSLAPRKFTTECGGLFLFVADLVGLNAQKLAQTARLPGSKMIPAPHALRACLALKLWSIERKSHVMALAADEGLALQQFSFWPRWQRDFWMWLLNEGAKQGSPSLLRLDTAVVPRLSACRGASEGAPARLVHTTPVPSLWLKAAWRKVRF